MPRLLIAHAAAVVHDEIGGLMRSLDRAPPDAEAVILCAPITGDAIVLGQHQVARSSIDLDALPAHANVVARAAGGPALFVGDGCFYVALWLSRSACLGGVDDSNRLINRHVRPLLAALRAASGLPVSYGGRDTLMVRGSPIGWVGARHRVADGACALEAIIGDDRGCALPDALDLAHGSIAPRWLGKSMKCLRELGAQVEASRFSAEVERAYATMAGGDVGRIDRVPLAQALDRAERPFDALVEEGAGLLGVRVDTSRLTIGGEIYASHDALEHLGDELFALGSQAPPESRAAVIDRALGPASGAMTFGIRSLSSLAKVTAAAWASVGRAREPAITA